MSLYSDYPETVVSCGTLIGQLEPSLSWRRRIHITELRGIDDTAAGLFGRSTKTCFRHNALVTHIVSDF